MDKSKLIKMFIALIAIIILVASVRKLVMGNSMSLYEYAQLHATTEGQTPLPEEKDDADSPDASDEPGESSSPGSETGEPEESSSSGSEIDKPGTTDSPSPDNTYETAANGTQLIGAVLNGLSQQELRYSLDENFYYEPLSDNLRRYITGVSYPAQTDDSQELEITLDELRYIHILHYDFDGNSVEGELICNEAIAQDLVEIFYELYRNEYQLERVLLIDEYDGDDTASMEDNNTSCFNYRVVSGTSHLSKHALGLAIDVNPFYNPYITYNKDGSENVSPAAAEFYADRSISFPYKIDENDLCYKLFIKHGFTWGGNWNSSKDYQHFQKTLN